MIPLRDRPKAAFKKRKVAGLARRRLWLQQPMERSDLAGHFATMNDMAQKPQYEPTDQQARYGGKLETKGSCVEVPATSPRTECYRLGKQCRESATASTATSRARGKGVG